jgi:AraC-like DNA-binding protein
MSIIENFYSVPFVRTFAIVRSLCYFEGVKIVKTDDDIPKSIRNILSKSGIMDFSFSRALDDSGDFSMIDGAKLIKLLDEAVAYTGQPSIAARSSFKAIKFTGVNFYLAKYSKDFKTALEATTKFCSLIDENIKCELIQKKEYWSYKIKFINTSNLKNYDRLKEYICFGMLAGIASINRSNPIYPKEIRFDHPAPLDVENIHSLIDFNVEFNSSSTEIIFNNKDIDRAIDDYDPKIISLLKKHGNEILKKRGKVSPTLKEKTENLIIKTMQDYLITATEIAEELNVSQRTYMRRLTNEKTSFSEILDEVRYDLAKEYLSDENMAISEIAFVLKYNDQAAFTNAFKRWANVTPKAFRKKISVIHLNDLD